MADKNLGKSNYDRKDLFKDNLEKGKNSDLKSTSRRDDLTNSDRVSGQLGNDSSQRGSMNPEKQTQNAREGGNISRGSESRGEGK